MTSSRSEAKGGRAVLAGCALVPLAGTDRLRARWYGWAERGIPDGPLARGDRLVITTQGGVRAAGTG